MRQGLRPRRFAVGAVSADGVLPGRYRSGSNVISGSLPKAIHSTAIAVRKLVADEGVPSRRTRPSVLRRALGAALLTTTRLCEPLLRAIPRDRRHKGPRAYHPAEASPTTSRGPAGWRRGPNRLAAVTVLPVSVGSAAMGQFRERNCMRTVQTAASGRIPSSRRTGRALVAQLRPMARMWRVSAP